MYLLSTDLLQSRACKDEVSEIRSIKLKHERGGFEEMGKEDEKHGYLLRIMPLKCIKSVCFMLIKIKRSVNYLLKKK